MKKIIGLSLAAVMTVCAVKNGEQLGSISIVGDTSSHANNIVETDKIKASNSIGYPLTLFSPPPLVSFLGGLRKNIF